MRAIRGLTLAAVVLTWTFPGAAPAAVLGPKIPLPVDWVWRYVPNPQGYVQATGLGTIAAASNGTEFLVAWSQRALVGDVGPGGEAPWSTGPGIYAVRIDAAGQLLDPAPIALALDAPDLSGSGWRGVGEWLAYAAASDTYLAAWGCAGGTEVCALHVSSSGAPLGPPIHLPAAGRPIVLSDGTDHAVVAGDRLFVVAADGAWTSATLGFTPGVIASDGVRFLGVTGTALTVFDRTGATLATAALPLPGVAATFDGTGYVVLCAGSGPSGSGEYVARVGTDGALLDLSPRLVFGVADSLFDMSFDGLYAVAAWCPTCVQDRDSVRIAVIDLGGAAVTADLLSTGPEFKTLAVASAATGISVVVPDGEYFWPNAITYHPFAQLLTTWAPLAVRVQGSGAGAVRSDPAGIDCGAACLARFDAPSSVTLTAAAAPGSAFAGWGGDCAGTAAACTVTLDAARSVTATFADATPPTLIVPGTIQATATTAGGTAVVYQASAEDAVSGPVDPTCSPASGQVFPPGTTRVTCTATDAAGNGATATFDVVVTFAWSGVLPPVDPAGRSVFKVGRTVPVKFRLAGESAAIADLDAHLTVWKVTEDVLGTVEEDAVSTSAADAGNAFRYDPSAGQYVFNLALSTGTFKLRIDLGDGVERSVLVSLKGQ